MPTRDIKTRLVLEGEQKYRKEMKDAAEAIKTLNSEQKLADAQFKRTGDTQEHAAKSAEILRKKIEEQQKAVTAAEAAIRDMTANGVQPSSQQMQTWQRKLNDAKTRLVNLETQLDKTEEELNQQGEAFKETGEEAETYDSTLESIDQGVKFQNTIAAIDNVRDHIAAVIKATAQAAKAMWDWEADAGKWADELATTASQMGIDVETLQSWQYASRFIDTDVESIIGAQDKLVKNMGKTSDEVTSMFAALGVKIREDGPQAALRDGQAVFWDVIDALREMGDTTEAELISQTLLGRSYRELKPLIEAGSEAYLAMAEEGREVGVVSAENVEALGALDDANQRLQASLEKTKYDLLAKLAPTFETVANAMATAVSAFNDFLQTEEGQAALDGLNDALSGIISSIVGENGEGFTKIVEGAKAAIEGLTAGLNWIGENGEWVAGAFGTLVAAWSALTVSKNVLMFMALIKSIPWHSVGSAAGKIAGAAGGGSSAGGAAAAAKPGLLRRVLGGAADGALALADAAPFLGPVAGVAAGAAIFNAADRAYTEQKFGGYNAMESEIPQIVQAAGDSVYATILDKLHAALDTYEEDLTYGDVVDVFSEYADQIAQVLGDTFDLSTAMDEYNGIKWIEAGADLATRLAEGIESGSLPAETSAQTMGANVATSVANGIEANIWRVRNAMASMMSATSAAPVVSGGGLISGAARGAGSTTAVIMMDKTVVGRMVAPSVDRTIGATVAAARRGG